MLKSFSGRQIDLNFEFLNPFSNSSTIFLSKISAVEDSSGLHEGVDVHSWDSAWTSSSVQDSFSFPWTRVWKDSNCALDRNLFDKLNVELSITIPVVRGIQKNWFFFWNTHLFISCFTVNLIKNIFLFRDPKIAFHVDFLRVKRKIAKAKSLWVPRKSP